MRRKVARTSSRVKSARGRARPNPKTRRQESANEVSHYTNAAFIEALNESLKKFEAACVQWRLLHSLDEGAAVRSLDQSIGRTEQENRAWREIAERESQDPRPERFAAFRCHDCNAGFLADRIFDVARKAELALLVAGHKTELTPRDEMLAESFEAPRKWMRCPECASANFGLMQEEYEVEACTIEAVCDVARDMLDELKSKLPDFCKSTEARIEFMSSLWSLCATMSRGGELAREGEMWDVLICEFGREEGRKRWVRWIEEKKIYPPGQL